MASVTYGKCIMANVIMAKIFMAKILWQMKLSRYNPIHKGTFQTFVQIANKDISANFI